MKKGIKKIWSGVLAASMIFSLTACTGGKSSETTAAPASETTEAEAKTEEKAGADTDADYTQGDSLVIKYCTTTAENQPSGHFGASLSKRLDELTGGRIKVECYYNSEMGKSAELLEGLQLGTVGEAATEVMDGEVGQEILGELEPSGFHGLGWVTGGKELWRLLTANKEIRVPADLKGTKIRIMSNKIHETFWNALGASAIPMAFSELYTALQNGTVDAQENPWGQIQGSKLYECQKYIIKTQHMYDFSPVLISKPFWDGLSDSDKKVIQLACDDIRDGEREYTDELQYAAEKEAMDYGCTVVELTPEEKAQWMEVGRSIYGQFADKIGQERIDKCLEVSAKYE